MSENKRKRTDDHYVTNFKPQPVQNRSHPSQSVIQQPLVVSSVGADQLIDGEHIQLLDGNVDANNQNLVYILLPPGTNPTQNILQGVQTVLLVPKEDQPTSENPPQLHYYMPPDKGKKDDDVVFVKDVKVFKDDQDVQYVQDAAVDPLQIQTIQDGHNVSYTVIPQYESNQLGNVVVVNEQYQKPQQQPQPDDNLKYKMQFKCDYPGCYLTFPSVYEKKVHAETHLFPTSSEFKCGICGLVFDRAMDRNKHVDSHAVVNTYKCKTCEKTFPYYTSLVKHVNEDKCASTRPHSCHYCGVQFVDMNDLEKHQKENTKHCMCHAKMCSEQAFELHTTWCTVYKQKMGKGRAKSTKKAAKSSDVIVLE